jgi:type VI secretion system secreted protein VgrG
MPIIRESNTTLYRFKAGDLEDGELRVLRFRGTEGISQLFEFELELLSRSSDIDFAQVVGKPAALGIDGPDTTRFLNGMISRFEQGPVSKGFTRYYAQMVPRQWTLLQRVDTRIFQNKSVPAIIESVLKDAGIPSNALKPSLQGTYKEREYCVQYQESDWTFLSRLMEEEGIFYFFEHGEDDHVLVIGDNVSAHPVIPGEVEIPFRASSELEPDGREYVASFRWSESVRIGSVAMRNYAFKTPKANLDAKEKAKEANELELYEYKQGSYAAADVGKQRAKARLEEQQALRQVATGEGVVTRFTAGHKFTLEGHFRPALDKEYLVTDVRHEGHEPMALEEESGGQGSDESEYVNQFRCIPSDVPYRPLRVTPTPFIRGTQTATVVGPSGEEIYCDEHARVKIHFHWDRRPTADENSSCWVRVAQPHLGGSLTIPRVGWEVLVAFHEGDPDQPFIIGRIHNADLMPTYTLPDEKTKTTFKTASTSGAEGFNEIRFEDLKGEEQLFIHAEKNYDVRVKNDYFEYIGHDRHRIVTNDEFVEVKNERHTKVVGDDFVEFAKDHHLKVAANRDVEVGGDESLTVKGNVAEVFKGNHSESTTGDLYLKGMNVVIEAVAGLTIKCGGSSVVLNAGGATVKGPVVAVDGGTVMIAMGPLGSPGSGSAGTAVSPTAPTAPEEADLADPMKTAEAKAEQLETGTGKYGKKALPPFTPEDSAEEGETHWIEIELVDEAGNPVPGERYEVKLPDGRVAKGTLNAEGFARVAGFDQAGNCEITFPDLDKDAWEKA